MVVVLKDKKTSLVGISVNESLMDMSDKDLMLEDNIPLAKISGHKGWYMAFEKAMLTSDILRYTKGLFAKEITAESLIRFTVPKMKTLLDERGLVKDRNWYNSMFIASRDCVYCVDSYFCVYEIDEFEVKGTREDIARGSMEFTKDLPAKVRMCEAFQSLNSARSRRRFPVMMLEVAVGKREIWWSYEDACKKLADEWTSDMEELYKKALQIVIAEQKASMTLLQRKLRIGYNKAGRLIERMEEENYVEEFKGEASRKVLITKAQFDERFNG